MQSLQSQFASWREHFTPVTHESSFRESGMITPEEFVKAGDYLVHNFPTWSWRGSDEASRQRDFLPVDKQYLVTEHVPSLKRAKAMVGEMEDMIAADAGDDGWVQTLAEKSASTAVQSNDATTASSDIPNLEDMALEDDEGDEGVDLQGAVVATRTYNIYLTYDKYYRTPRIWLYGWSESRQPLSVAEVYEDVSGDHAGKTVTIETFPHKPDLTMASVHPCKHSSVMKTFIQRADEAARLAKVRRQRQRLPESAEESEEASKGVRVDKYLVIFLKFISSVMPTIEADYTMQA